MSSSEEQKIDVYSLEYPRLRGLLSGWGYSEYFADKLWKSVYVDKVEKFDQLEPLRPGFLPTLRRNFFLDTLGVDAVLTSSDGLTTKYLLRLKDGERIECVTMEYEGRTTACISSQVGCAMGCVFCATGQMGFKRNLTRGEIVAQIVFLARISNKVKRELRNVVFMGMGEPLHNYDETMSALQIITHDKGLAFAPKHVTISTVGLPIAIQQLADEEQPFNLAVSLHAATDEERTKLVPINKRWSLDEVMQACREYAAKRNRRIFFEWALVSGENDTLEQARALGELLQGLDSHVNIIPVNPTKEFKSHPVKAERIKRFQQTLAFYGIPSTIRQKRGIDIAAGCGQLRTQEAQRLQL